MMAAVLLARKGHSVHVFEQNEKLGKKLYITGKGRCNLTNACETMEELMGAVVTNPKFLYSSFYQFDNHQVMDFFEELGVPLKVERGGRVFPKSDKSSDVIRALERQMKKLDVKIHLKSRVEKLLLRKEEASGGQLHIRGIQLENKTVVEGDRVLVASGGMSYPSTGADGSGYRFARSVGHEVVKPVPSLVPLLVQEGYVRHLQGLSLRNIQFSIWDDKKCLYREFGELLFTHQGISGPVVLSASAAIGRRLRESPLTGKIDLKPALSEAQLDARILREFENNPQKQLKNVIGALYPASLTPVAIRLSGISPGKPVSTVSRQERQRLLEITKAFPMTIMGAGSFKEAIITKGGISVREIHPSTMESKLVSGLYFIGEVLDLDAMTGGFNLQIAWSTGYLAGDSIP